MVDFYHSQAGYGDQQKLRLHIGSTDKDEPAIWCTASMYVHVNHLLGHRCRCDGDNVITKRHQSILACKSLKKHTRGEG